MVNLQKVRAQIAQRQAWHSLPQPFYTDDEIFQTDLDAVFGTSWTLIGFEVELAQPGSYLTTTIGRAPVIILRNRRGEIAGFFNSCRHRGAKICTQESGQTPRLVCPYHQWTYDLDGKLLSAQRMDEMFDKSAHGLRPIRIETVGGCIYAAISDQAPDFAAFRAALERVLPKFRLDQGKIAHVETYDEIANWKLVVENGRECLHCAVQHPELCKIFPVTIADGANAGGHESELARLRREAGFTFPTVETEWWQTGQIDFLDGVKSYSLDGQPLVNVPLVNVDGAVAGSFRWATEPNSFCHVGTDCAVMVTFEPIGPQRTRVVAKFLVHKDAVEGVDFNRDRLIAIWDATNRQDQALAENNQAGVNGTGYTPGPYSKAAESYVNSFVEWYLQKVTNYIDRELHSEVL